MPSALIPWLCHTASGAKLAIEADGPSHFLQPGMQPAGVILACNRALAARAYVVVVVPPWEWSEVTQQQQQQQQPTCQARLQVVVVV